MYAVIRTGGKQYRVAKDDVIAIERVDGRDRRDGDDSAPPAQCGST